MTILGKAKPSQVYQNLVQFFITSRFWSQAVVCVSTPRMYPRIPAKYKLVKGPSINYVSTAEGGRGQPNAHGCSRGGRGCI